MINTIFIISSICKLFKITIILFYIISDKNKEDSDHDLFSGIFLFVILFSCIIMAWSLIREKKKLDEEEENPEIIDSENHELEEESV